MPDKRLTDIIGLAIEREEQAYVFYMDLYDRVDDSGVKDTLEWIAGEEVKHKEFLVRYREGQMGQDTLRMTDVVYYQIAEHQKEPDIEASLKPEDLTYDGPYLCCYRTLKDGYMHIMLMI